MNELDIASWYSDSEIEDPSYYTNVPKIDIDSKIFQCVYIGCKFEYESLVKLAEHLNSGHEFKCPADHCDKIYRCFCKLSYHLLIKHKTVVSDSYIKTTNRVAAIEEKLNQFSNLNASKNNTNLELEHHNQETVIPNEIYQPKPSQINPKNSNMHIFEKEPCLWALEDKPNDVNKSIKKSSNSKPVVKSIDLALIDLSDDDFTNQQDHNSFQKAIMTTNFTGILLEGKRKNHEVGAANKDMIPKKRGPDYSKTENLTLKVLKQSECEHGNKQNNRDPNNLSDIELNTVFGINLALQNYMNERSAIISCRSEDKKLSKPEKFQKNSQNKSNSLTKKSTKYKIRRYGAVLSKQNEKEYYYPLLPLNKSTQNAGATNTQLINIVKKSTDIVIKAKNNESHIIEKNLVCTDADPADLLVADHSSLTENNAKSICTDQLSPGNHPALLEKTERLSPTAITSQPPTHKQVILAFANAMKVVSK